MNVSELADQNPWWRNPELIDEDLNIREWMDGELRWIPRLKAYIDLENDRIYTLRGPRQVGKTTLLKIMIRELLLERDVDPWNVFYYSCDLVQDPDRLVETVMTFIDISSLNSGGNRNYIFLDEISSVSEWASGIKHLADMGRFQNATVVLTGSHSLDLKHSAERMPGRLGEGDEPVNKMLTPMKFSEYVETVRPELTRSLESILYMRRDERLSAMVGILQGNLGHPVINRLMLYRRELVPLLDSYMVCGGIIRAVKEYHRTGRISGGTYEIYIRSLFGDLALWKYQETYARHVIRALVKRVGTRFSLNSVARETPISAHATVTRYMDALEESFVILTFNQLDLSRRTAVPKKEGKAYFTDPFIYHAHRGWTSGAPDYFSGSLDARSDEQLRSAMAEMLVAGHLVRLAYNLSPSDIFTHQDRVFFWRKKGSDKEVDFVLSHADAMYPVEVKYQNRITRSDYGAMRTFRHGLIVSKDTLESDGRYAALPLDVFLMLI